MLRELSLQEVASATRLSPRVVEALEADDYAALQDRGHALLVARSCAAAIGLDPEEAALRLEEQLQRSLPPMPLSPWQRLWQSRPREPLVWIVLGVTLLSCVALLLRRH